MRAGVYRPDPPGRRGLAERLAHRGPLLLLDGATGTALEQRGVATPAPLWSAAALETAPRQVREIHAEYVAAGCEVLTANTFRTQRRSLARHDPEAGARAAELTARAVALAREAGEDRAWVLGSTAPLEDCYRPDRVPPDADLATEHGEHARHLASAGVDAALLETMNTLREARAALRASRAAGLAAWLSFVCDDQAQLLSGEALADGVRLAADEGAAAVLVNCLPPTAVPRCLDVLAAGGLPFGAYANLGAPEGDHWHHSEDVPPERYAGEARRWIEAGARIVGGCCGTSPAYLRAVAAHLDTSPAE